MISGYLASINTKYFEVYFKKAKIFLLYEPRPESVDIFVSIYKHFAYSHIFTFNGVADTPWLNPVECEEAQLIEVLK